MKTQIYASQKEWLAGRRGKITGSRLKEIIVKRGSGKKMGFYELIAERLGIPADGDDPMDRGHRLEAEAVASFEKQTGKKVNRELVIWSREDNQNIAVSPDGTVIEGDAPSNSEAIEIKCLSSSRHIQAAIENHVPSDYDYQVLQYFIVNDELETLNFVMYDPRIVTKPYICFQVKRADVQTEVDIYLQYQRETLAEVERWVEQLSNF